MVHDDQGDGLARFHLGAHSPGGRAGIQLHFAAELFSRLAQSSGRGGFYRRSEPLDDDVAHFRAAIQTRVGHDCPVHDCRPLELVVRRPHSDELAQSLSVAELFADRRRKPDFRVFHDRSGAGEIFVGNFRPDGQSGTNFYGFGADAAAVSVSAKIFYGRHCARQRQGISGCDPRECLEPDNQHGFGYLEAIRNVFGKS